VKESLARILEREGYIDGYEVSDSTKGPGRTLLIRMKYTPDRHRTISGVKRVSRPGLRVYTKSDRVPVVLGGMGIAILSTNQGLMTDREARERRVGGEILCQVW
jgi:small subunit ribosomal protein S8